MKDYSTYYRDYYHTNKDKFRGYREKYKQKEGQKEVIAGQQRDWRSRNRLRNRLTALRNKCNTLGLPFDLEECDLIDPEVCPILGIPLDSRDRDHTPSVDQIIPRKGYTKKNTHIISMRANRIKSDATVEELDKISKYLKNLLTNHTDVL